MPPQRYFAKTLNIDTGNLMADLEVTAGLLPREGELVCIANGSDETWWVVRNVEWRGHPDALTPTFRLEAAVR